MTVALVLGAGGPVGYAFHAGVLAALADAGWDPRCADLVVGTSIGAVTAGLLRAGMDPADLVARVERTPLSPAGRELLARAGEWPTFPAPAATGAPRWGRPASPALLGSLVRRPSLARPGLVLAALTNAGTVDTEPIRRGFDRLFGDAWPAGTVMCAVDLDRGDRVAFGAAGAPKVDMGRAVAASCAVPSYFAPVDVDGRRYVDGGVHSPANTDLLDAVPELSAVVVSVPMGRHGPPGRRGIDLPGRTLNHREAARGVAPLLAAGVPVLLVEPTRRELEVMHYDAFDMTHLPSVARRARTTLGRRLAAAATGATDGATSRVLGALVARPAVRPSRPSAPLRPARSDGLPHPAGQAGSGTAAGATGPT